MDQQFVVGLDIGQQEDPSALAIVERIDKPAYDPAEVRNFTTVRDGKPLLIQEVYRGGAWVDVKSLPKTEPTISLQYLDRFPLGTHYTEVVDVVTAMANRPPLSGEAPLVIDATGVGRPIVELFLRHPVRRCKIIPVTITAGDSVTNTFIPGQYTGVPKRTLIAGMQVLLQQDRLVYPPPKKMPLIQVLLKELEDFRYKVTVHGNDTYNAKSGAHDDMLLACALAVWHANQPPVQAFTV